MIKINAIEINDDDFEQKVEFVNCKTTVTFKLDTGADCNVMPVKLLRRLKIAKIKKSPYTVVCYNKTNMKILGQVTLQCKIENTKKK